MTNGIYEIDARHNMTRVADNAGQFATEVWQQNWADTFRRTLVLREGGKTVVIATPRPEAAEALEAQ